jgi:hypothetical protein
VKRLLAAALLAGCAAAPPAATLNHDHAAHAKPAAKDRDAMWQASLARALLAATAAFDARGQLWQARVEDGRLLVSRSDDAGKTFLVPVAVNREPERIAADGENRPKLAFGNDGEVYVSWTQSGETPFSGHVRFARSLDGGRTFDAPLTVNDNRDPISHRFDSLLVTPDGNVHLTWLDKRNAAAAGKRGEKFTGISLYHAVSTDRGASFSANRKLADHTCECCRVALAIDTDGTPVAFWRHVFGTNIRDHALLRVGADTQPRRVTHEQWAVDACPHHGPALAIGTDGVYHLTWFSGAPGGSGLYYARSGDRGVTLTPPLRIGHPGAQAGRAALTTIGGFVTLAWKEFDGQVTMVRMMQSADSGSSWTAPRVVMLAESATDHPQLLVRGRRIHLAWNALREGFRVTTLDGPPP